MLSQLRSSYLFSDTVYTICREPKTTLCRKCLNHASGYRSPKGDHQSIHKKVAGGINIEPQERLRSAKGRPRDAQGPPQGAPRDLEGLQAVATEATFSNICTHTSHNKRFRREDSYACGHNQSRFIMHTAYTKRIQSLPKRPPKESPWTPRLPRNHFRNMSMSLVLCTQAFENKLGDQRGPAKCAEGLNIFAASANGAWRF